MGARGRPMFKEKERGALAREIDLIGQQTHLRSCILSARSMLEECRDPFQRALGEACIRELQREYERMAM